MSAAGPSTGSPIRVRSSGLNATAPGRDDSHGGQARNSRPNLRATLAASPDTDTGSPTTGADVVASTSMLRRTFSGTSGDGPSARLNGEGDRYARLTASARIPRIVGGHAVPRRERAPTARSSPADGDAERRVWIPTELDPQLSGLDARHGRVAERYRTPIRRGPPSIAYRHDPARWSSGTVSRRLRATDTDGRGGLDGERADAGGAATGSLERAGFGCGADDGGGGGQYRRAAGRCGAPARAWRWRGGRCRSAGPARPGQMRGRLRSGRRESRGMEAGELLGSSAFSLALGAAEGEPGFDPAAMRWGVWGKGDYGVLRGPGGRGRALQGRHADRLARRGCAGAGVRGAGLRAGESRAGRAKRTTTAVVWRRRSIPR